MRFEIDMLDVGNGDAIIIRYFNDDDEYVVLIDAGKTAEHGQQIEKHISKYTTKKSIDLAINTHPDDDHIGGFFYLLKSEMEIKEFWIHDPSLHKIRIDHPATIKTSEIEKGLEIENVKNINDIEKSLSYVLESLRDSNSILKLIDNKKIPRSEPFDKLRYSKIPIQVVGPSKSYYEKKLDRYRDIDILYEEQKHLLLEKGIDNSPIGGDEIVTDRDYLDRNNDKSNENNSSVILCLIPNGNKYLFTADAGPEALNEVKIRYNLSDIYFMQIPHHGSRYNITSELLDYFNPEVAYISCKKDKHYPSSQIVNILKENRCSVFATGIHGSLRCNYGLDTRDGYSVSQEI